MPKKICIVVGTRPEAIKMAPVFRELRQNPDFEPILLSTGQHKEMLLQALGAFGLTPDFDLELMRPAQTLPDLTARAISAMSNFLEEHTPDAVLVQGDTTSVLAAALASFYNQIPVGHIEAGLRTGNMKSPWPEEMNRRLTTPLCDWNFAPTELSRSNLLNEGITKDKCFVTGNTVIDALLWMKEILDSQQINVKAVADRLKISDSFAQRFLNDDGAPFILVTGHRRESFGQGLEQLCDAFLQIVEAYPEIGVLYPVHLNPAVRNIVHARLGASSNIELIEPVGYEDFTWLMNKSRFIISDSGGVQEEAPTLGKPVLVTRETTERPEGVDAGTCRLVGTDVSKIMAEVHVLLTDQEELQRRSQLRNPYGDGHASEKICKILTAL